MTAALRRALAVATLALCATGLLGGQAGSPATILVVVNDAAPNPFGRYLPEILRTEGLTDFAVTTLDALTTGPLASARLVLLADTPLSVAQAALFSDYVAGGGRLVAMRPDAKIAALFGIDPAGGATTSGYVLVDQNGPGAGLQAMTLPFRGAARHYTLAGATEVAALYTTNSTTAGYPAIVRYNRTAAWSFDLARSTIVTRQGDPAVAGQERDGLPVVRTNDVFYQNVDLERTRVPHADVQMRLLTRVLTTLLEDLQPTPRLWYFPGTARTLVVPTADSHTSEVARYTALLDSAQSFGARVTLYLARFITVDPALVASWRAAGHEVSVHPYFNQDGATLSGGYATAFSWFAPYGTPGLTVRHHTVEWFGFADPVEEMIARGVRMDTSFYTWGPAVYAPDVQTQAYGYITGSGLPMRFATGSGLVRPVYQQVTSLIDEQLVLPSVFTGSQALTITQGLAVSRALIDESEAGGHSAIVTQFHVDHYLTPESRPWADGTMAYAASRQIPMWTAQRWLRYVEARADSVIRDVSWTPAFGRLTFGVSIPSGSEPQTLLLPATFAGVAIVEVTVDGQAASTTPFTVNGQALMAVQVGAIPGSGPRQVRVDYGDAPAVSLAIQDASVVEGNAGTTAAALTVTLSAPSDSEVAVSWSTGDGTATAGHDYQTASGRLVFPAGATTQQAFVTIDGDLLDEPSETVTVSLSAPEWATIADGDAVLTIIDDDDPLPPPPPPPPPPPLTIQPPSDFRVSTVAGEIVTLRWTPPAAGPAPVRYRLEAGLGPGQTMAAFALAATPPILAVAVPPGVFHVRLRAETAGAVSVPSQEILVDAGSTRAPSAPASLLASVRGAAVALGWRPTFDGGVPAGYVLDVAGVGAVPVPFGEFLSVDGVPGGTYVVRLRAVNAAGSSAPSGPVTITVPAVCGGPPHTPSDVFAYVADGRVVVTWDPPASGPAPTGYVVDVPGVGSVATSARTVSGVVPSGTYALALRAVNLCGSSPPSPLRTVVVP